MGPGPGDREGRAVENVDMVGNTVLQWGPALGTGRDWTPATGRAPPAGFNGARPWGPGGTFGPSTGRPRLLQLQWGPALGTGRDAPAPGAADRTMEASMGPGPGDREGRDRAGDAVRGQDGFNGARPWGPGGTGIVQRSPTAAGPLQWGPALGTGRDRILDAIAVDILAASMGPGPGDREGHEADPGEDEEGHGASMGPGPGDREGPGG